MVTNLRFQPLGMGNPYIPAQKSWVQLAAAAVGLGASLLGSAKASQAARASERKQRQMEAKEDAWYNRRYNEDYIDTAAGQNLVRRAKEYAKENWKKAAGAQAVAGGTAAATQMAKDAGNKMVGDTIANIAATDTMRKDRVDSQHRAAEQQFGQMDMNREMQRAQNISNAASSASNAIMSAGAAIEQGSAKAPSLQGGYNNGVTFSPPSEQEQVSSGFMGDNAVTRAFGQGTEAERQAMRRAIMQGG